MTVILLSPKNKSSSLVASYIGAAYWFTASTSFANPAAVLGRMMSDTFAGISPHDAPAFVAAEITGIGFVFGIYKLLESKNS
jgi:glycerol uptake facilitator-like aquaporin